MEIDALPDELLLQIFALVADADTLLDGVARTCKRWLRVSRDPAAWANVRVEVRSARPLPPHMPSSQWRVRASAVGEPDLDLNRIGVSAPQGAKSPPSAGVRAAARALLRAPALRAVVLDYKGMSKAEIDLVTSALSRCRAAQVREVNLVEDTFRELVWRRVSSQQLAPLHAVTRLLWRHRDCLRALTTSTDCNWDLNMRVTEDGRPMSFLDLLAELRRLEELRLEIRGTVNGVNVKKYAGELRDRLPRLHVLVVLFDHFLDEKQTDSPLFTDLLRGAAASLRAVDMTGFPLPDVAALAACTGLRDLQCNVLRVPVIRGMTHLRRLHLLYKDDWHTTDAQLRECLRVVEQDCGEALAGVRALQLDAFLFICGHEKFRRMLLASELFAAVARGAPLAEDVSVHMGLFYMEEAEEYVPLSHYFRFGRAADSLLSPACLPSVRRLRLHTCLPADLDRVAALPDSLVEVVVEVYNRSAIQRDMFAAPFEEAVARLKESRPGLKVDLNIHATTFYLAIPPLF